MDYRFGYNTLAAANAAEALEIVDGCAAFDLLFTDVIMPGKMNGRQLAQEVATQSTVHVRLCGKRYHSSWSA